MDEKARPGRPKKGDHERLQYALNCSPGKFGYQKDFWYPKLVLSHDDSDAYQRLYEKNCFMRSAMTRRKLYKVELSGEE